MAVSGQLAAYVRRHGTKKIIDLGRRPNIAEYPIERCQCGLMQSVRLPGQEVGYEDHLVLKFDGIAG
jgi:hypothetical protein